MWLRERPQVCVAGSVQAGADDLVSRTVDQPRVPSRMSAVLPSRAAPLALRLLRAPGRAGAWGISGMVDPCGKQARNHLAWLTEDPVMRISPLTVIALAATLLTGCPTRTVYYDDGGVGGGGKGGQGATAGRGAAGTTAAAGGSGGQSGNAGGAGTASSVGTGGSAGGAGARGTGGIVDAGRADASVADGSSDSGRSPPSGSILWARSASSAFLTGVVEGSIGVQVSGILSAPSNLGGSILTPVGASDAVLAEYALADGAHLFSSRFGGGSPAGTGGVFLQIDGLSMGSPLLTGNSTCNPSGSPACNQIDVGLGLQAPGGGSNTDGVLGVYSVSTGAATWVDRLVGPGNDQFLSVATGASGQLYVAGWYDQSTVLYAGNSQYPISGAGDRDILIAQVGAASGAVSMIKTFATPSFEEPQSIAWTGSEVVVSGTFAGSTTLGGTTLNSAGDFDIWVAKLRSSDLSPVWAVSLGGANRDRYPYMTVDSAGNIYVCANISGPFKVGSTTVGSAGGVDILVAKLSNADGHVLWATSIGSAGDDGASSIAIDALGHVVIAGNAAGPVTPGGSAYGNGDALIASFTSDGVQRWTKIIGTTGTDYGFGVAAGSDAIYAVVDLGANLGSTIEGVPILGAPNPTGLVLKIQP